MSRQPINQREQSPNEQAIQHTASNKRHDQNHGKDCNKDRLAHVALPLPELDNARSTWRLWGQTQPVHFGFNGWEAVISLTLKIWAIV